jgi:tetratricopeptide (TPR) repeat protein
MASAAQNWTEVLKLTGHLLALDPLAGATGYVLDLDPVNYADAYFYDALANYELGRIDAAEKSGLKAEHLDLRTHFPQLHLVLAEIFARKHNYSTAVSEVQTFLDLAPTAKNIEQVRERLAELQKLDASASATDKPN